MEGLAEVLWRGGLRPGEVVYRQTGGVYRVPDELVGAVERAWEEGLASGRRLFDGELVRLEGYREVKGALGAAWLELELGRVTYKPFYGLHMARRDLLPAEASRRPNPLGVSAVMRLACGRLVMGWRGAGVAYYPGRLHPVAGGMEPGDADVFAAARRELLEELSLPAGWDNGAAWQLVGLVRDVVLAQPEAVVLVDVVLEAGQLGPSGDEHTRLELIAPTGLTSSLWAALTPVGRAALGLAQSVGRPGLG